MSVVAIVGRPNVGKSTLFNRLTGRRIAIVEDVPGVTRDRNYAAADLDGKKVTLVDTGGLAPFTEDPLMGSMALQVEYAVDEADLILFVVDVNDGLLTQDMEIAAFLRKKGKTPIVVVNKVDGPSKEDAVNDFYKFGFETVVGVSAAHKVGISDLLDVIVERLPDAPEKDEEAAPRIKISVLGRPNVGKSSFVNSILGSERLVVSPLAGTTRDAIDTLVKVDGKDYILIDTAGIRRKSRVEEGAEAWSVMKAIGTIDRSDVCLLLIDSVEGITDQDLKILDLILRGGRPVALCLNKWDLIEKDEKTFDTLKKDIAYKLGIQRHVPVLSMSALTGQRVGRAFEFADHLYEEWSKRITTSKLNAFLEESMRILPPPIVGRKRARIYYGTQVETAPPAFHFFSSYPEGIPEHYERYLMNRMREAFGFEGVPLRIFIKRRSRRGESKEEE